MESRLDTSYGGLPVNWSLIPETMIGGLRRYIEHGIPPGHFLTAVLCNDLEEACGRADDDNITRLGDYIKFLNCHAPNQCWGSKEKFEAWCRHEGLSGTGISR